MKQKTPIGFLLAAVLILGIGSVFAFENQPHKQTPSSSSAKSASHYSIPLYQNPKPNSPRLKKSFSLSDPWLVIIYSQDGQWAKVANRRTGDVGWIKRTDYHHALSTQQKQLTQRIIVTQKTNASGKPIEQILAYRNGKALSKEEAKSLYQRMSRDMQSNEEAFLRMNDAFMRMNQRFFELMPPPFSNPVISVHPAHPTAPDKAQPE